MGMPETFDTLVGAKEIMDHLRELRQIVIGSQHVIVQSIDEWRQHPFFARAESRALLSRHLRMSTTQLTNTMNRMLKNIEHASLITCADIVFDAKKYARLVERSDTLGAREFFSME